MFPQNWEPAREEAKYMINTMPCAAAIVFNAVFLSTVSHL